MIKMDISFLAGAKYNNKIFFSAMDMNSLFSFDCENHELKYIKDFEKEEIKNCIHACACIYKNAIWFIPWEGKYLVRVDMNSLEIEYYDVPQLSGRGCAYRDRVIYNDRYLFMIPSGIGADHLIKVDLEEKTLEDCGNVSPIGVNNCAGGYLHDGKLNIMSADGEVYYSYSLVENNLKLVGSPAPSGYQSLLKTKDRVVMIPLNNDVLKVLDNDGNVINTISCGNNYYFGGFFGDYVWIFPFDTNREAIGVCLVDKNAELRRKKIVLGRDNGKWLNIRLVPGDDDEKWLVSSFGEILKVDKNFEILERHFLSVSDTEEKRIIEEKNRSGELRKAFNGVVNEGIGLASLNSFIYAISNN